MVSDPVRTGLVTSLARLAGNVTGTTDITADLVPKRLALLKEVVPCLTRGGGMKNPDDPGAGIAMSELETAAQGLELHGADVRRRGDLEPAFAALTNARVGSLIIVADAILAEHSRTSTTFARSET